VEDERLLPLSKLAADNTNALITIIGMLVAMSQFSRRVVLCEGMTTAQAEKKQAWRDRLWWLALCVIALTVARTALSQGSGFAPDPPQWQTFHSPGGYAIDFPYDISESTNRIVINDATLILHQAEYFDRKRGVTYKATWREPGDGAIWNVEQFLAALEKEWGNPISRRAAIVGGVSGEEISFRRQHGGPTATSLVFPSTGRFCWITTIAPPEHANDPQVARFFKSFRFESRR
jgi:hypothetical protein